MREEEVQRGKLEDYRKEIDKLDDQIIDSLNKRGEVAQKIGTIKKLFNMEVHNPKRERELLDRLKKKSEILNSISIEAIWKEILSTSKLLQGFFHKVGYLGPKGTFTHQAALDYFPKSGTEFKKFKSIGDIFDNIEKGVLDFGVIPIENSLHGTVRETLDLLIDKELLIYGEIELRIVQNLISLKNSKLENIKNIISHSQAFAQTKQWIKINLPEANLIEASSTAEAVRRIKENNNESYGAIGPEIASNIHGLKVLNSRIEDNPANFTRFLIISKKENEEKEGQIKTSLVFVTKHVPGALFQVLKIFADAKINLSKIESRPRRKGRWEYIFLMDFEGDKDDPEIRSIFNKLSESVIWYKILGSYPMVK